MSGRAMLLVKLPKRPFRGAYRLLKALKKMKNINFFDFTFKVSMLIVCKLMRDNIGGVE
jgi:hypothetical protein